MRRGRASREWKARKRWMKLTGEKGKQYEEATHTVRRGHLDRDVSHLSGRQGRYTHKGREVHCVALQYVSSIYSVK